MKMYVSFQKQTTKCMHNKIPSFKMIYKFQKYSLTHRERHGEIDRGDMSPKCKAHFLTFIFQLFYDRDMIFILL